MAYTTCIIKNIDNIEQNILGVSLQPNGTYQIPDSKRINAINSSDLLNKITLDIFQIGDGSQFFTDYAEQINWLNNNPFRFDSDGNLYTVGDTSIVRATSAMSSNLKTHYSDIEIELTTSHADIFTVTAKGILKGFALEFNSNKTVLRLEIDGKEIFDLSIQNLESIARFGATGMGNGSDLCRMFRLAASDRIEFCPPNGIEYSTNFKIQAKETSSGKKVQQLICFYTDES